LIKPAADKEKAAVKAQPELYLENCTQKTRK